VTEHITPTPVLGFVLVALPTGGILGFVLVALPTGGISLIEKELTNRLT
jgi:hypothetical protein